MASSTVPMDIEIKHESDESLIGDDDLAGSDSDESQSYDESSYHNDNPYITIDHFLKSEISVEDGQIQGHDITGDTITLPKKPTGRPCNPNTWKKNKQKLLRNSGQAYVSYNNKIMPAKKFIPNYDCGCKKKCNTAYTDAELQNFFSEFWKIGNYKLQNEYLRGMIEIAEIKRRRVQDGSRKLKTFNLNYNIKIGNKCHNVCKKYFLTILQLGWGRVHRIFRKEKAEYENRCDRTVLDKKAIVAAVIDHIRTFPSFQTQFSRKLNKNRRYLNPKASVRKMYELYEEKCRSEGMILVKEKYYYGIFSRKFDLHFKIPTSNVCLFCENLQIKIDSSEYFDIRDTLLAQKKSHLNSVENDQIFCKNDTQKASTDIYVCSFDLQKPLPFPRLTENVSLQKRNLFLNNLSFYCYNNKENYFYYWDETEGCRTPDEIASIVLKHLIETASETFEHFIIFTTDLNRTQALVLTLLKIVNDANFSSLRQIDLKFMLAGHSFLTNSRDFDTIERNSNRNRKFQNIYGIDDWLDIFSCTTKKSLKPHCISVDHTDFLDSTTLKKFFPNFTQSVPNFSRIRWFRFQKGNPFGFEYKLDLNEKSEFTKVCLRNENAIKVKTEFPEVDFKKEISKSSHSLGETEGKFSSVFTVEQSLLYKDRRPVSLKKKQDLLDLLVFIPEKFRGFYRDLPILGEGESDDFSEREFGEDDIIYD